MLPALRCASRDWACAFDVKSVTDTARSFRRSFARGQNPANLRDVNAFDARGDAGGGRRGEEQLVVFSAVENLSGCRGRGEGQGGSVKLRGDAGFGAEMGEIGGEAVAQVDGGSGQTVAREPKALREARRGKKMPVEQRLEARRNGRKWR